jgi:hypothetical protein
VPANPSACGKKGEGTRQHDIVILLQLAAVELCTYGEGFSIAVFGTV